MSTFSQILRLITLAVLFGGSTMIVFAAITLVHAAVAKGIPVADAATANVPIFLHYSKIALGCGIGLLIAEAINFAKTKTASKLVKARWAASGIASMSTMVLAFAIVPLMKELLPLLKTSTEAHQKFQTLHHSSEAVFSIIIVCALVSLLLPVFETKQES